MSTRLQPDNFGPATRHAPVIIAARTNFIQEIRAHFPRASLAEAEEFIDYMLRCEYVSAQFFAAWCLLPEVEVSE